LRTKKETKKHFFFFFLHRFVLPYLHRSPIRRRMTDTDGFRKTPHPSSVTDGMGGPNPPSVIRHP
jgi:hypothetical protein